MIHLSVDGETHVATITLDRPDARNAIDVQTAIDLEAAFDQAEGDDVVRAIVLTATPPVFCAGADLKAVNAGLVHDLNTERGGFAGITQRVRSKALIAAVEGPALAGGAEIVMSCDLVVASTAARFGLPEVKRSIVAAAGGLFRLGRRVPLNIAMECVMTGDPITAERAHGFGFVNVLTEPGDAE